MFKRTLAYVASFIIFAPLLPLQTVTASVFSAPTAHHSVAFYAQGDESLSSVLQTKMPFSSVGVQVEGDFEVMMVNFGEGWGEVELHDDYGLGLESLILTPPSTQIQFKALGVESDGIKMEADFFFDSFSGGIGGPDLSNLQASNGLLANGHEVISRAEWGADESLRIYVPSGSGGGAGSNPCAEIEADYGHEYQIASTQNTTAFGEDLTWPIQTTSNVEKFAVHHTDTEIRDVTGDGFVNSEDYRAIVRSIYQYHTKTRGWGDIGYNYLIDPLGNIYEGRSGGDKSIGAHALCFNPESIGIAMIGNYENEPVSEAAFEAVSQLIGQKSKLYNIDPLASGEFRGLYLDNVYAHKDVRATSCPGEALYSQLDHIRLRASAVMQNFDGTIPTELEYNAQLMSALEPQILDENEKRSLTLTFKNTGTTTWDDKTWLHVADNQVAPKAHLIPVVSDKYFVAADLIESSVPPGKTGRFKVQVNASTQMGYHTFQLTPVVNGKYKISRARAELLVNANVPYYDYEFVSDTLPEGVVFQGQYIEANVRLKNTGDATWYNSGENPILLGTEGPRDRQSLFLRGGGNRLGTLLQSQVKPGEVGDFKLKLYVPSDFEGPIQERFTPVVEYVTWLHDKDLGFSVEVQAPTLRGKTTRLKTVTKLHPGDRVYLEVEIENIGNVDWDPKNVKTTLLGHGMDVFERFLPTEKIVKPGESMRLGFWTEAPMEEGYHGIYLRSRFGTEPIRGSFARYVIDVSSRYPSLSEDELTASTSVQPVIKPSVTTPKLPSLPDAEADDFRVRLSHVSDSARLTANTPFILTNESGEILFDRSADSEIEVSRSGSQFEVKGSGQTKAASVIRLLPKDASGVTEILTMERRPSWNTGLNDNRFRGAIEMRIVDNEVAYINELPLEDYLHGLAEVSNSSPTEKQKVIAVLARTYAQYYMSDEQRKFPEKPYDGSDDPNVFQRYLGYGVEIRSPNFVKAVEATEGQVVTYNGQLVKTPYFSQSDGRTRSAQEVWGWTTTPYLKSVDDPWSEGMELLGHGVGLSGYGATKQAEQGKTFEEIIKYYYDGVEISQ